jgi:adenosine deaminase
MITHEVARSIPKVSLHCHLLGSVPAATAVELASRNGVRFPGDPDVDTVYDSAAYADLGAFMSVYDLIGASLLQREDYRRITYESLTIFGADHNVWYREINVSPQPSPLPYRTALTGILDGMRDARSDSGIESRIVIAINREHSVAEALSLVEEVIEHRVDEVLGIGLDYQEVLGPPAPFAPAFALAEKAGLNQQVPFTCTPVSSDIDRYSGSGDGSHRRIQQMVDAGLRVCIDSDDPPMFGTDPSNDYHAVGNALGYDVAQLITFTANAIESSWLDTSDKDTLRARLASWTAGAPSHRETENNQ